MALGAGSRSILRLVMAQGMRPALAGIAGSVVGSRLIEGLLYDVPPRDPAVLAAVGGLLFAVALVATILPAFRATMVNPVEVMRNE